MRGMSRAQIEALKARYPAGTRVQLDRMGALSALRKTL